MKKFIEINKLRKGDKVAILSPSAGLPGLFPWVQDLGLERLRNEFGLVPIEYPTTRKMGSTLKERAKDLEDAFGNPEIKAVITSIGGSDQIKLIKYLDPKVFTENPKPFVGFSDNTHLHNFLWSLGIPSYYGAAIMTQFAMQGGMMKMTTDSVKKALFEGGDYKVESSPVYNDEGLDWADKDNLNKKRKIEENDNLFWDGESDTEGILWGGCVESLIVQATVGKYLPTAEDLDGTILFIETAEDVPEHWVIEYLLTGFGERGWFDKFRAILVGRPKAWDFNKKLTAAEKEDYRNKQRETVVQVVREYNKDIPIIQNIDFGHTDPQIIIPMGRRARVLGRDKEIYLDY